MLLALLLQPVLITSVHAHGYMEKPAQRGSMWRSPSRYPLMARPADYNDNSLNAGGPGLVRASYPMRRYGVCGDPYTQQRPRLHETGGRFGRFRDLGVAAVAECYTPGTVIDIHVRITAHHRGSFWFTLCVPGDGDESEACFRDGYALQRADGAGSRYSLPDLGSRVYAMQYRLPSNVECDGSTRCVLRWYYLTGNSPGSTNKEVSVPICGSRSSL